MERGRVAFYLRQRTKSSEREVQGRVSKNHREYSRLRSSGGPRTQWIARDERHRDLSYVLDHRTVSARGGRVQGRWSII